MERFQNFILLGTIIIIFLLCFGIAGKMDLESEKTLENPPKYDSAGNALDQRQKS